MKANLASKIKCNISDRKLILHKLESEFGNIFCQTNNGCTTDFIENVSNNSNILSMRRILYSSALNPFFKDYNSKY